MEVSRVDNSGGIEKLNDIMTLVSLDREFNGHSNDMLISLSIKIGKIEIIG